MVLEGVDDACLPCLDFFCDDAVLEVELHGYLAEGVEPGEFAGLLKGCEAGFVADLEGDDFGGDAEGF